MRLPPLGVGAGAGLLAVLLLAPATGTALGTLAKARDDRARLAVAAAAPAGRPAPIVTDGLALDGGADVLIARIREQARGGGVLVEEARPLAGEGALVTVRFRLSGPEKAVVALADTLERQAPLVRLRGWTLEAIPGGVRLSGDAVAVRR